MKTKVLVAEDEVVSRRITVRTLEVAGYEVIAVDDGRKAVEELCKPDGPRLALIDWMMPELEGPEVCREVRERCPHDVFIVLLTSKKSEWDVSLALKAGANDYLIKPLIALELKKRMVAGLDALNSRQ